MKRNNFIVISALALLMAIAGTFLFYSFYMVKSASVYRMEVDVTTNYSAVGFNLDPDKMHFGKISVNETSGQRFITVGNSGKSDLEVVLQNRGEIKDWVAMEVEELNETFRVEGSFILKPKQQVKITYMLIVPENVEPERTYTGKAKVLLKRTSLFG